MGVGGNSCVPLKQQKAQEKADNGKQIPKQTKSVPAPVVQHRGCRMEGAPDAVAHELPHHRQSGPVCHGLRVQTVFCGFRGFGGCGVLF